jgi:hypothetical protein
MEEEVLSLYVSSLAVACFDIGALKQHSIWRSLRTPKSRSFLAFLTSLSDRNINAFFLAVLSPLVY